MKSLASRLRRRRDTPVDAPAPPIQAAATQTLPRQAAPAQAPHGPTSQFDHSAKWYKDIAKCLEIHQYLSTGQPVNLSVASQRVRNITDSYLHHQSYGDPQECDQLLDTLIEESTSRNPLTRELAVTSCLHAFSVPAARQHISELQADAEKYLRLLRLVNIIRFDVLPAQESLIVQYMHPLPSENNAISKRFHQLLLAVEKLKRWHFLNLEMLQELLFKLGWEERFHSHIQGLLDRHEYLSAFKAVSWLKSIDTDNLSVRVLLDDLLPGWQYLRIWEPVITRVSKFELNKFSVEQRRSLVDLFSLDGPDTYTMKEVYLAKLDRPSREPLLHLLYRCCCLGTHAVDLFIILCMSPQSNERGSSCMESILNSRDDSCCLSVRLLLETTESEGSVGEQLKRYTTAFSIFPRTETRISFSTPPLNLVYDRAIFEMDRARQLFLDALERTSGKKMGMLIHAFGALILERDDIFGDAPGHLLDRIREHPPRDTLETIFERIWVTSQNDPINSCRLKIYLAERLGGRQIRNLNDSITPAAMNNEIKFWKDPKGTARTDLARIVERFRAMDYANYTSWLLAMLDEDDQFVIKTKDFLLAGQGGVLLFGEYLATRRNFKSMRHETWLLLFVALIQEQGPRYLRTTASSMPVQEWHKLTSTISTLIESIRQYIPQTGMGLTLEQLDWWMALSTRTSAVQHLLRGQVQSIVPIWLYFPQRPTEVESLLDRMEEGGFSSSVESRIVPYLSSDGTNLSGVLTCIRALQGASRFGKKVFKRQIERHENKAPDALSSSALRAITELWISDRGLSNPSDHQALRCLGDLLCLPSFTAQALPELRTHFEASYNSLLERLEASEKRRLRMHISDPDRTRTISNRLEIESIAHSRASQEIPEEIADAVEVVDNDKYELSFPLTALNDLHCAAKGIPSTYRLFVVQLTRSRIARNADPASYIKCMFDGSSSDDQNGPIGAEPTFFGYYVRNKVQQLIRTVAFDLLKIHELVAGLISNRPDECLMCSTRIGPRMWKPATCSVSCSRSLRQAPLEARLHNLAVSPKAIDLLLASVFTAASEPQAAQFLPFCPVPLASLRDVINSMPSLDSIQTANDMRQAIRGSDRHGSNREALLSYLCLRFRGLILSNFDGYKIPGLGVGAEQFLIANSNHERETAFGQHYTPTTGSTIVFHGTRGSRLFPILTDGLRVANSQNGILIHGAAHGPGIYCGHDMQTSWGFAGSMGQTWQRSALGGLKVMLGCELAPSAAGTHGSVHVISDETRLLVRYVFLLPQNFQCPIRPHVEPAMVAGIAKLRSG